MYFQLAPRATWSQKSQTATKNRIAIEIYLGKIARTLAVPQLEACTPKSKGKGKEFETSFDTPVKLLSIDLAYFSRAKLRAVSRK